VIAYPAEDGDEYGCANGSGYAGTCSCGHVVEVEKI